MPQYHHSADVPHTYTDWATPPDSSTSSPLRDKTRLVQNTLTIPEHLPFQQASHRNSTVVIRRSSFESQHDESRGPVGDAVAIPLWPYSSIPSPTLSTDASGVFSPTADNSTRKTSYESRFSPPSLDRTTSSDRARSTLRKPTAASSELSGLSTIQESPIDRVKPTIETVERASAAKIYLETYFYERLFKPNPREVCRRHVETNLLRSNMSPGQRHTIWEAFNAQWAWHLRESRVLKIKSTRATKGESAGPCLDDFEIIKLLGKGSFGVVKLVCEKPKPENSFRKQVYAMKVIRKADMVRNAQEGHIRAERDLLAAAEGSNW